MKTKVKAGGLGGAGTTALVWTVTQFGLDMPAVVAAAFVTLIGTALAYWVPERDNT